MNKLILMSISCILFLSCGVKLNTEDLIYKEGVTIKAERIIDTKGKEVANVAYFAPKGTRFIQLHLIFENKTDTEQTFDTENIFLLDDRNNKYSNSYNIKERRVKAGNSRRVVVNFEPAFPEGSKIRILIVDKIYDLPYSF